MSKSSLDIEDAFDSAAEQFFNLKDLLSSNQIKQMRLSEVESVIDYEGRELLRLLLQGHVDERGLGDIGDSITGSDGIVRTHKRIRDRYIKTLFGTIKVERIGYSSRGENSLFPKDGLLNLPQNSYSFSIQKLVVEEAIRGSFEEGIKSIERILGITIPKRQAETIVLSAAGDFYSFYEQQQKQTYENSNAQKCPLLILTLDGKGIAMRKESLREETRQRAENSQHNLKSKLSPGEKKNSKRIAVVASVYLIDRFIRTPEEVVDELFDKRDKINRSRPKPEGKRVWASLEHSFKTVVSEMFEQAIHYDPNQEKEWVALVDGDKKQITYLLREAKRHQVKLTIVCDFIHVLEYLWKASHTFFTDSIELEKWVKERLLRVLQGKSSLTVAGMRRSATNRGLNKTLRYAVDKCAVYLLNLNPHLKYQEYLKEGYPIATGVIEGACRYLVKDRMGITGARWGLEGAEAILKLRSLKVSGEFDNYWIFHERQEFIRNHLNKYAEPTFLKDKVNSVVLK